MIGQVQGVDATAGTAGIDRVVLKQAGQPARRHVVAHQPVGQQRHPAPADGGFAQDVGVVALQAPLDVELNGRVVMLKGPVLVGAAVIETQALMLQQIPRVTERRATRQIRRTGHHPAFEMPHAFADDVFADHG